MADRKSFLLEPDAPEQADLDLTNDIEFLAAAAELVKQATGFTDLAILAETNKSPELVRQFRADAQRHWQSFVRLAGERARATGAAPKPAVVPNSGPARQEKAG